MWYLPVDVYEEVAGRTQAALTVVGVAWRTSDVAGLNAAIRRALLAAHLDRTAEGDPGLVGGREYEGGRSLDDERVFHSAVRSHCLVAPLPFSIATPLLHSLKPNPDPRCHAEQRSGPSPFAPDIWASAKRKSTRLLLSH